MISGQSDSNESKTIEALVPMVDLFAVLAIMFMIYSTDEITYAKQESAAEIQKLTEQVEEVAEEEQERKDRREHLAQKTGMSLEQLKAEQAKKAQELLGQFTAMVAAQQSQAAIEYENLVSQIEFEHDEALEQEETSLQEQGQADLAKKKVELETALASRKVELETEHEKSRAEMAKKKVELETDHYNRQLELEEEKKEELVLAKLQYEKDLTSKVSELTAEKQDALQEQKRKLEEEISAAETTLEGTRKALAESDQQRKTLSAQKELELANQKKELAKVEKSLKEQAASQAAKLEAEKERALAEAEAKAKQERQKLEAEKKSALAKAEQKREKLEAEKNRALAKAEKARKKLEAEKAQALAKADEAEKLASETEQYLTRVVGELNPYLKAEDAKQKIVEQLKENFKDIGRKAVEIDEKTGKVKLHFQQTYFARGSYALSEDMKSFLRIMIPKYAKSIYENKAAAKHVDSLKISGMTSPVYQGRYIDIHDRSPGTEKARRYNMKLSNKRALAMYNFIFDEAEMKNFKYRDRLKADMGIAALGFQNAKPVMKKLVGKPADCKQYDCQHEQATVLQFHMLSED